jgi:hypothetical protein
MANANNPAIAAKATKNTLAEKPNQNNDFK